MKDQIVLRIVATVAFAGTVVVNAMANLLPINNLTTGEVSDIYPSLFTPAGVTFSIWSVIYFLLVGFIIYSWIHRYDEALGRLMPLFITTCVLNAGWILVWHHLLPGISVLVMIALLVTLAVLFLRVQKDLSRKRSVRFLVALPFTLYFAWICVATIANISALLVAVDWSGWFLSPQQWTVAMMAVAAALASRIVSQYRTPAFAAVVIWALIGIFIRWKNSDYDLIIYSAIILAILVAANTVYAVKRKRVI